MARTIPLRRQWLGDFCPGLVLVVCLVAKFVYASRLLDWSDPRDHAVITATLATVTLVVGPLFLLPRIARLLAIAGTSLTLSLVLLADELYFRRFGDIITLPDLASAHQVFMPFVWAAVVDLMQPIDCVYVLDIAVVFVLLPWYASAGRMHVPLRWRERLRFTLSLLMLGLLVSLPPIRVLWPLIQLGKDNALRGVFVGIAGIVPYHIYDIVEHFTRSATSTEAVDIGRLRMFLDRRQQQHTSSSALFGIAKGRNVILIQAESLNSFPIGLRVNGQEVAPNLTRFARESLRFVNFFDQTYQGGTSDGEFTALTSLHPLPAGAVPFHFSGNHFRALPTILSEAGYATLSACTAAGNVYDMSRMHPGYGFQVSFFEEQFEDRERFYWISDGELFRQMLPRLAMQRVPLLAFLVTSSNHAPYQVPTKYRTLTVPSDLDGTTLGNYLQSVNFFDRMFGEFIKGLHETGLLDQSIVALYGDHPGLFEWPPQLSQLLGFSADDEARRWATWTGVPLLIRLPHAEAAGVRHEVAGHLDIAPTLLGLLGIRDEDKVMLGRDLTGPTAWPVVFRDGSFVDQRHLLIRYRGARGPGCFTFPEGQATSCTALEAQRREAVEQLLVSDTILNHDLMPALVRSQPPRTLSDLGQPEAYSREFGLQGVSVQGMDMAAHPPSGAVFTVPNHGENVRLMFTPAFNPAVPRTQSDGATFEIWVGATRKYGRHVIPGEYLDPVVIDVPPVPNGDDIRIAFLTTSGPYGDSNYDWAVWRDVRVLIGNTRPARSQLNLATRNPPLRLFDLAPPTDYARELNFAGVQLRGVDLIAEPPSGATFAVPTHRQSMKIVFTPSFQQNTPVRGTDGVTFEVWSDAVPLYKKRVFPTDHLAPVTVDVPNARHSARLTVSFLVTADPKNNSHSSGVTWRDVKLLVNPAFTGE